MNDIFITSEDGHSLLGITDNTIVELVIPDFIKYIDEFALTECINLREIHLPGNSIYWHSSSFQYCPSLEWLDADEHNTHYKSVDGVLYSRDLFHIVS